MTRKNAKPSYTRGWHYVVLFMVLEAFIFLLLSYNKKEQTARYYRQSIGDLAANYESVFLKYQKLSEAVFCSAIDNSTTASLLAGALKDKNERDASRRKLEKSMSSMYLRLKELGVKQFQFHLPDNTSFFRFHEPLSYGDTLSGFRHTVQAVSKTKTPAFGFEEGRAASGFRYVFPILKDKNYLGSVEFGIDYDAILASMRLHSGAKYALIVKKDAVSKPNIFKNELNNFSSFLKSKDYLLEGRDRDEFKKIENALFKKSEDISLRLNEQKPFFDSAKFEGDMYTVGFYPINDVRGVHTAYIVEYKKDHIYEFYNAGFTRTFGVYTLFMAILLSVIFFVNKKRQSIWELNSSLEQKSAELQAILDASGAGLAIVDTNGCFLYANSAFCVHLGYEKDELRTLDIYTIGIESQISQTNEFLQEALTSGSCFNFKKVCLAKNGESIIFSMQLTRLPDSKTLILSAADITKDVEYARTLELRAATDSLTKVLNRQSLEVNIQEAMAFARENNDDLCLIIMDIDNFKAINDTYGHTTGDSVLKGFSELVTKSVRTMDVFGRWGGEEFLLICKGLSLANAAALAEKIRGRVEASSFDGPKSVTCSFGVAIMRDDDTMSSLFDRADDAMYEAKRAGRNRVAIGG